jgi:hypothetical protein
VVERGYLASSNEQHTLTGGVSVGVEPRIPRVGRAVWDVAWSVVAIENIVETGRLGSRWALLVVAVHDYGCWRVGRYRGCRVRSRVESSRVESIKSQSPHKVP